MAFCSLLNPFQKSRFDDFSGIVPRSHQNQFQKYRFNDFRALTPEVKKINPNNAGLWFAEAAIALRAKQPKEAIPLIQRGLQIDSNNAAAYFDLGNARIMQNKFAVALQSFEKATEIKPDFWEALNNQALVLFELGQHDSKFLFFISRGSS